MSLDGYDGEAEIITEHGAMLVWADLYVELDERSNLRSCGGGVTGQGPAPFGEAGDVVTPST
jgi:hypothetical protein